MEDNQSFLDLQVNDQTATQLHEASKWAKFLAIAILAAAALVALLFAGVWSQLDTLFQSYESSDGFDERNLRVLKSVAAIVLVIMMIIIVILMVFLLKAANAIRTGVMRRDAALLNLGLANLRNYFAMYGVLSLVGLLFSLIGFFFN